MGRDLADGSAAARDVFGRADEAFAGPLSALCFDGSEGALRATHLQQPAIVAVALAAFAATRAALGLPGESMAAAPFPVPVLAVAGHSVGLCAAMVAAGALALADAIALVVDRGRYMTQAAEQRPGAMAAVLGLDPDAAGAVVERVRAATPGSYLAIANYNAPRQVVVAGDLGSVAALGAAALAAGARRVVPLPVSGAFHSAAMVPARDAMRARVVAVPLVDPAVPVMSNVDATPLVAAAQLRAELADHIAAPVRWLDSVRALGTLGVTHVLEFGPGDVLAGLVRRTLDGITAHSVNDLRSAAAAAEVLRHG